jgi:hypothetical protein
VISLTGHQRLPLNRCSLSSSAITPSPEQAIELLWWLRSVLGLLTQTFLDFIDPGIKLNLFAVKPIHIT